MKYSKNLLTMHVAQSLCGSIFCYECMFAYIVFELVFQYYLRNDLFCVRWDLKPYLSVSIDNCIDLDCFSNC